MAQGNTTAERIREIIDSTVEDFGLETETRDTITSARIIAAEIDALTDTVAQMSARCDTLTYYCASVERALVAAAAERDEARAEVERLRAVVRNY